MKRTLLIMRHAKSSWDHPGLSDRERPLNKRGRRDSPRVATYLRAGGWIPQQVISSSAVRTRETWSLMSPLLPQPIEVTYHEELYLADAMQIVSFLENQDPQCANVMVLGHNPGLSSFTSWLSGVRTEMTTANVAILIGQGETWADALSHAGAWRLEELVRPRNLPQG